MGAAIRHPFPLLVSRLDVECLALVQLPDDFSDIIATLELFRFAKKCIFVILLKRLCCAFGF